MGLRVGSRTLVTSPDTRDHPSLCHLDALESKRRVARKRRRSEALA